MFLIKEEKRENYYVDMMAGVIVHVDQLKSEAKQFESKEEAEAEIASYPIFLDGFEVVEA